MTEQIDNNKQKLILLKKQHSELDKSKKDNISLLSELSFMIWDIDITEGEKRRELIDKMVNKIAHDHDSKQQIITIHYKLWIGDKKYKVL